MTRPKVVQKCPKIETTKIEGCNTRFRTFPWPEIRTTWGAFWGHGLSLDRSQMAWNEYMDAFTFILRQFCVSLEMNKCVIQRHFKAMQMVQYIRATLQVMSAFLRTFQENMTMPGEVQKCPKNSQY